MTSPFDDPHYQPPAEISDADARLYEEKIVELLRGALLPGVEPFKLSAIELRGRRPNTQIVFHYRRAGDPTPRAAGIALWKSLYPTDGAAEYGSLHETASVAGWIVSDWTAGDLEPVDLGDESNPKD